ncbi:MAG: hypothetical protein E6540_05680, partial [Enterococcus sp.]|nr:hypothetical protein [Enterococcus sp.]
KNKFNYIYRYYNINKITSIYQNSNLNILKGMIREQIGIGFLAELAISPEDKLVTIPITDSPQPTFMISLVQREQILDSTIRAQLIELIREFSTNDINKKNEEIR